MDLTRVILPYKDLFLAKIQQDRYVVLGYDMAAAEGGSLEAVPHGGDVMAQGKTHRVLYIYLFHMNLHFPALFLFLKDTSQACQL
jgi:hypothetical protein